MLFIPIEPLLRIFVRLLDADIVSFVRSRFCVARPARLHAAWKTPNKDLARVQVRMDILAPVRWSTERRQSSYQAQ